MVSLQKFIDPQTSARWVYGRNASKTLINDLRAMSEDSSKISMSHKEETMHWIKKDLEDRPSLRETLWSCVDLLDLESNPDGKHLNIVLEHIAP